MNVASEIPASTQFFVSTCDRGRITDYFGRSFFFYPLSLHAVVIWFSARHGMRLGTAGRRGRQRLPCWEVGDMQPVARSSSSNISPRILPLVQLLQHLIRCRQRRVPFLSSVVLFLFFLHNSCMFLWSLKLPFSPFNVNDNRRIAGAIEVWAGVRSEKRQWEFLLECSVQMHKVWQWEASVLLSPKLVTCTHWHDCLWFTCWCQVSNKVSVWATRDAVLQTLVANCANFYQTSCCLPLVSIIMLPTG